MTAIVTPSTNKHASSTPTGHPRRSLISARTSSAPRPPTRLAIPLGSMEWPTARRTPICIRARVSRSDLLQRSVSRGGLPIRERKRPSDDHQQVTQEEWPLEKKFRPARVKATEDGEGEGEGRTEGRKMSVGEGGSGTGSEQGSGLGEEEGVRGVVREEGWADGCEK